MRKILISMFGALCVCSAFAAGENIATSKAFVDTAVAQKQDKIPANSGAAQVLTNTGEQGAVGTKDIYDSSAAYVDQTDSLIDAATMNAAVQNAIEAEFKCIKWVDDDPTKDCLLVEIRDVTDKPSGKNLLDPSFMDNSTYGPVNVYGHAYSWGKVLPTENGKTYTLSATLTGNGAYYYYLGGIKPDGTRALLGGNTTFSGACGRYLWNTNDLPELAHGTTNASCHFTAQDDAVYVVYFAGASYVNNLTISNYQMEEGNVATPYSPYQNLYIPSGN